MDYIFMSLQHQENLDEALERAVEMADEKQLPVKFKVYYPDNHIMVFPKGGAE